MKAFDYYSKNPVLYPNKDYYTTVYYYKQGKRVATKDGCGNVVYDDGQVELNGLVTERAIDHQAYDQHRKEYREAEQKLHAEFRKDLYSDLGIDGNEKADLLFAKAWDRGHSSGFYEVYNTALDLVDLIK